VTEHKKLKISFTPHPNMHLSIKNTLLILEGPEVLAKKDYTYLYRIPLNNGCPLTKLPPQRIGHIRILGIGLELACNGGSCGGISLISA